MATTLIQFDFPFQGPWGDDLAVACRALAADIAGEPGLVFKLWGEDPGRGRASGVYLFEDPASAERYVAKHRPRLAAFGVEDPQASMFRLHRPLSRLTRAPV